MIGKGQQSHLDVVVGRNGHFETRLQIFVTAAELSLVDGEQAPRTHRLHAERDDN